MSWLLRYYIFLCLKQLNDKGVMTIKVLITKFPLIGTGKWQSVMIIGYYLISILVKIIYPFQVTTLKKGRTGMHIYWLLDLDLVAALRLYIRLCLSLAKPRRQLSWGVGVQAGIATRPRVHRMYNAFCFFSKISPPTRNKKIY